MNLKRLFHVVLVVGVLSIFAGCEKVTDELVGKKPEGAKTILITMVAKSSSNPVFLSAKTGALAAAENLSDKYSMIDVKINWRTPEIEDANEQAEIIRAAVRDGTDAVVVSCSDKDSLTSAINEAVEKGVEVMTFDSDAPDSKRFAFYGPDDVEMGKNIMARLARLMDGEGEFAILGGNKGAPNLQERVRGIREAAAEYTGIQLVGEFYHPENEADAVAEMLRVNELFPQLKGWAMVGGWPMFGSKLLDEIEPGKYKIVAVDALPIQLVYIEKDYVQVLLGQPTFRWGEISVEKVVDKIHLKKEVDEIIRLKPIPVTIDNLGGWSRQLRAWGYKGIPDKYLVM